MTEPLLNNESDETASTALLQVEEHMAPKTEVKYLVAGIGEHCLENLVPAIQSNPLNRVAGFITRTENKRNSLRGLYPSATFVSSIDDVNCGEFDILVCAGPPDFNSTVLRTGLQKDLIVFVEKPLEKTEMATEHQRLIKNVQVGYNLTFSEHVKSLKKMTDLWGPPENMNMRYNTNKPRVPLWGDTSAFSSFVRAILCHPVHLASQIFGFETLVSCNSVQRGANISVRLILADSEGRQFSISACNWSSAMEIEISALFASGDHVRSRQLRNWEHSNLEKPNNQLPKTTRSIGEGSLFSFARDALGFSEQFKHTTDIIRGESCLEPAVGYEAGLRTNKILEKVIQQTKL